MDLNFVSSFCPNEPSIVLPTDNIDCGTHREKESIRNIHESGSVCLSLVSGSHFIIFHAFDRNLRSVFAQYQQVSTVLPEM